MRIPMGLRLTVAALAALLSVAPATHGQSSTQSNRFARFAGGPRVVSPEVSSDRKITFRILAADALKVRVTGGDMPAIGQGKDLTRGSNGVWEVTLGPIDPGAYRYNFNVDGVSVIDPRNPDTSESNMNVWSMVNVPGSDFMDTKNVLHGAVASVTYYSSTLKRFRRMHVYTPPDYGLGWRKYPVFYLLHGASDSDASWSTVGRAGFILDNLIAAKKAKPMVVVMPAGHTGPFDFGRTSTNFLTRFDEFLPDFLTNIMPYVESHYRVRTDRQSRAIAGLSMGGSQTLNIAFPHLEKFGYIGVFSSGLFSDFGRRRSGGDAPARPAGPTWEEQNLSTLDNPKLKKGFKLIWLSTGGDDFVLETTRSTVALLTKHGFSPVYHESTGGHTWINWRNYLNEFAPQLFQ